MNVLIGKKTKHSDSYPSVLSSYYYTLPDENSVWLGLQVIGSINTASQFSSVKIEVIEKRMSRVVCSKL